MPTDPEHACEWLMHMAFRDEIETTVTFCSRRRMKSNSATEVIA